MGFYINPHDISKEDWLKEYGELVVSINKEGFKNRPKGKLPVVLVNNGAFIAAGICYCEEEYQELTNPRDTRPKTLYFVRKEELLAVCPALERIMEKRENGRAQ